MARFWLPRKSAGIYGLAGSRDGLEIKRVACDFDQHESTIRVETFRGVRRRPQIVETEFAGVSHYEIIDAFLGLEPLVDMLVAGQHHVHPGLLEDGFDPGPQIQVSPMKFGVRVKGMMEITNVPVCSGLRKLFREPIYLRGIHIIAVQRKKGDVTLL